MLWLLQRDLLFFGAILIATTLKAIGEPFQRAGASHTAAMAIAMLVIAALFTAAVIFLRDIAEQTRTWRRDSARPPRKSASSCSALDRSRR